MLILFFLKGVLKLQELNLSSIYSKGLPVIDNTVDTIINSEHKLNLNNTLFVCVQHLLVTTKNMLDALVSFGVSVKNIHIMGKPYSTCDMVVSDLISDGYNYYQNPDQKSIGNFNNTFYQNIDQMWQNIVKQLKDNLMIKSIIILDDGGSCICRAPSYIIDNYDIVGVEQTASGIVKIKNQTPPFPIIDVATSASKKIIESPMIADAVVRKLEILLPDITRKKLTCGIIGLGAIGNAVVNKLINLGHKVITYDKDNIKSEQQGVEVYDDVNKLIYDAEYIFGCSGSDVSVGLNFMEIQRNKCFVSCSSHDVEFLSLIQYIRNTQENIQIKKNGDIITKINNKAEISILRKGYPVNFDGSGESVESNNIQLTRGLLLGGILQAIIINNQYLKQYQLYMLLPDIQKFIIDNWVFYGSKRFINNPYINKFKDLTWIANNSGGILYENELIKNLFHK